jgi:superkiller protein 3
MKKQFFLIFIILILGSYLCSCNRIKNEKVLKQFKSKELRDKALNFTFTGITDSALLYFDSSLFYNNKYSDAYAGKSIVLVGLNKYDEAIESIDKAIKYDKKNGDWYYNKGYIFYKKGDYEEAIKSFNNCIKKESKLMKRAYYYNGLMYINKQDTIKALGQFEKAYDLGLEEAYEYIFLYRDNKK